MQDHLTISPTSLTTSPAAVKDVSHAYGQLLYEPNTLSLQKPTIQFKLSIGEVDDPLEREADAMADTIMRMPEQNFIQRKCSHCEEEEKLQRKPLISFIQRKESSEGATVSNAISNKINTSKGNGSSMDSNTQTFMQSRFGADFSDVKIHTGSEAIQMNRELNAKAFTVGNDIYFNEEQYNLGSEDGKHLLAHELMHTIQQNDAGNKIQRVTGGCPPTPINLELIPDVMSANVWPYGATVLRQWFNNPAGGGPTDTSTVTVSWVRSFARANTIYNSIFTDKIYANDGAKMEIIRLLTRLGVQNSQSFNFNLPITNLDPTYYINHRVVDSVSSGIVDDLTSTLGNFDFRVLVAGNISSGGLVTLTDIGVYVADSFDFEGFQYLGCWNTCTDVGNTDIICDGDRVYNSDFRDWRTAHSRGGDYKIYSNIETTHLATPEKFRFNRTNKFTSTFEVSARLVSTNKFLVSSGGGVAVAISNCTFISPFRNPLPTDRIGISLYKEGLLMDSEISEKILRVDNIDTAVWNGLDDGDYFIVVTFNSTPVNPYESVEGDISVDTFN